MRTFATTTLMTILSGRVAADFACSQSIRITNECPFNRRCFSTINDAGDEVFSSCATEALPCTSNSVCADLTGYCDLVNGKNECANCFDGYNCTGTDAQCITSGDYEGLCTASDTCTTDGATTTECSVGYTCTVREGEPTACEVDSCLAACTDSQMCVSGTCTERECITQASCPTADGNYNLVCDIQTGKTSGACVSCSNSKTHVQNLMAFPFQGYRPKQKHESHHHEEKHEQHHYRASTDTCTDNTFCSGTGTVVGLQTYPAGVCYPSECDATNTYCASDLSLGCNATDGLCEPISCTAATAQTDCKTLVCGADLKCAKCQAKPTEGDGQDQCPSENDDYLCNTDSGACLLACNTTDADGNKTHVDACANTQQCVDYMCQTWTCTNNNGCYGGTGLCSGSTEGSTCTQCTDDASCRTLTTQYKYCDTTTGACYNGCQDYSADQKTYRPSCEAWQSCDSTDTPTTGDGKCGTLTCENAFDCPSKVCQEDSDGTKTCASCDGANNNCPTSTSEDDYYTCESSGICTLKQRGGDGMSTGTWMVIISGLLLSVCLATVFIIKCCLSRSTGGQVNNDMGEALQAENE